MGAKTPTEAMLLPEGEWSEDQQISPDFTDIAVFIDKDKVPWWVINTEEGQKKVKFQDAERQAA